MTNLDYIKKKDFSNNCGKNNINISYKMSNNKLKRKAKLPNNLDSIKNKSFDNNYGKNNNYIRDLLSNKKFKTEKKLRIEKKLGINYLKNLE